MFNCLFRIASFLSVFILLGFSGLLLAANVAPEELLARVVQQSKTQSYKASAVYIKPSGMESVDIERGESFERIIFNKKPTKKRVRSLISEIELIPSEGIYVEHEGKLIFNSLEQFYSDLPKGFESYKLFISEHFDRVAGRPSTRLSIISLTPDRYSFIYWVDTESYVVLRTDVLNENGELIERMVFTSFSLKNDSDWLVKEAVAAKNDKKHFLTYDSKDAREKPIFNWLPERFELYSIESVYDSNKVFAHERIVLSDGFAWVEIYTQKNDHKPKLTRGQQLDAWHIYKGVSSGKNISVEGQLPYAVLEKIGLNMTLVLKDD